MDRAIYFEGTAVRRVVLGTRGLTGLSTKALAIRAGYLPANATDAEFVQWLLVELAPDAAGAGAAAGAAAGAQSGAQAGGVAGAAAGAQAAAPYVGQVSALAVAAQGSANTAQTASTQAQAAATAAALVYGNYASDALAQADAGLPVGRGFLNTTTGEYKIKNASLPATLAAWQPASDAAIKTEVAARSNLIDTSPSIDGAQFYIRNQFGDVLAYIAADGSFISGGPADTITVQTSTQADWSFLVRNQFGDILGGVTPAGLLVLPGSTTGGVNTQFLPYVETDHKTLWVQIKDAGAAIVAGGDGRTYYQPQTNDTSLEYPVKNAAGVVSRGVFDMAAELQGVGSLGFNASVQTVLGVIKSGQSLSVGGAAYGVITTTAPKPDLVRSFNCGVKTFNGNGLETADNVLTIDRTATLQPAFEVLEGSSGEDGGTQLGCVLTDGGTGVANGAYGVLICSAGVSGASLAVVGAGTNPARNYIYAHQRGQRLAAREGKTYWAPMGPFIQGEANKNSTLQFYYDGVMALQQQYDAAVRPLNPPSTQDLPFALVIDQLSNWTALSNPTATCDIPLAQVKLAIDYPDRFVQVGPKWDTPFNGVDGIHKSPTGYYLDGERQGWAMQARLNAWLAGSALDPAARKAAMIAAWPVFTPRPYTRVGAVCTVPVIGALGSLILDTTSGTTDPGNKGVVWNQTGGTPRIIQSVAVVGSNIVVTLDGDPGAPSDESLGFGTVGVPGQWGGKTTGPRHLFRDSVTKASRNGIDTLYRWMSINKVGRAA